MAKTPPELAQYKKQQDSPYVSHARDLMETGYGGIKRMTPRIDTMNEDTQADINSRLGSIYNRAKSDFDIDYRDTMQKTMANQYGKFGTTGGTPSLYRTDMADRTAQRALADLAYNKAENYENDVDRELKRRYNTLSTYNKLYGYGEIPQRYDDQNYKMDLTNQDRAYQNDFNAWKTGQQAQKAITNAGIDALALALAVPTGGASMLLADPLKSGANSMFTPNADMTYSGHTGWGTALGVGDTSGSGYQGWGSVGSGLSKEDYGNILGGSEWGGKVMEKNKGGKSLEELFGGKKQPTSDEEWLIFLKKLLSQGGGI